MKNVAREKVDTRFNEINFLKTKKRRKFFFYCRKGKFPLREKINYGSAMHHMKIKFKAGDTICCRDLFF